MNYQVTLFSATGKYRPVAAIVTTERINLKNTFEKKKVIEKGVQKICQKRGWSARDVVQYQYLKCKVREVES